jgi:hypothetical protein
MAHTMCSLYVERVLTVEGPLIRGWHAHFTESEHILHRENIFY